MLLAERLRNDEEKDAVRSVIESELKVKISIDDMYYGEKSDGCVMLEQALRQKSLLTESGLNVNSIAPTRSIMRLVCLPVKALILLIIDHLRNVSHSETSLSMLQLTLVMRCVKQSEPVLLVGDTGCGKVNAKPMYVLPTLF